MEKVYIGCVVNTHGIKGEIRIKSDFPYKDKVFKIDNKLIIDGVLYTIKSYRVHKEFDMVTLDGFDNINEVLFLMKKSVYFDKDSLVLDEEEVLDSDLIKYKVCTVDGKCGTIDEIFYASRDNKILRVMFDREVLIPFNSPLIKKLDKRTQMVTVELIDGM